MRRCFFKVVFAAIFGFVYAPLVITGLHHMTNAIDLQLIAFDVEKIKAAGHPLVTMMVVTDDNGNEGLTLENGKSVTAGADSIAVVG